jgi:hypothetical protein
MPYALRNYDPHESINKQKPVDDNLIIRSGQGPSSIGWNKIVILIYPVIIQSLYTCTYCKTLFFVRGILRWYLPLALDPISTLVEPLVHIYTCICVHLGPETGNWPRIGTD